LPQRLVLDIFEEIKGTGGCTLHPPPRVSRLVADAPGLLDLGGLREAVVREAQREGLEAVAQLEQYEDRFATAAQVVEARLAARLTQRQLAAAAGVSQYEISLLENGSANPTLTTLARLSRALGIELRIGNGGAGG
ncbi:MAG TPA: helix-turn-helix transcriptional regulator, partial [Thermoleophilia bacterium]|nr:helix-turn-helix transcriptional regulator [Thermoleophilia bacterium]